MIMEKLYVGNHEILMFGIREDGCSGNEASNLLFLDFFLSIYLTFLRDKCNNEMYLLI